MARRLILMIICTIAVLCPVPSSAQIPSRLVKEIPTSRYYSIGSHYLRQEDAMVREYLRQHPDALAQMKLRKPQAWNFVVGSAHTWYSVDFTNSTRYVVTSTCRAVGTNCYVFVEDSLWNVRVNQAAVDSVRNAFDLRCPANASKGIYQMDVDAFGNPPDVDNDPRIIILLLNIRDGFTGSGGFIEGYFSSYNEIPQPQSNAAEIYFLDANPLNLLSPAQLQEGLSTTAHEFQHMIHFNYDQNEITFINEGCSLVAEVNCGYPIYDQSGFNTETNHYLFDWRSGDAVLNDYSRAARFATYLRDQEGIGFFRPLVASPQNGAAGIDAALTQLGSPLQFGDLFRTWTIANILNDTTASRFYGYVYPNMPPVSGKALWNPNVSATADTVQPLAAEYLVFQNGSQLQATFTAQSPSIIMKAVEIGPSSSRVLDVTSGMQFSEPEFGSTYTTIAVVLTNTDPALSGIVNWQSSGISGAIELKWDAAVPDGYYKLYPGDTICVTFDGVSGGRLDSVRAALRGLGTMTGGVWQYTGALRPTPLGARLAGPFTVTGRVRPSYPYPDPWPNWIGTNLTSSAVSVSQPFVVGYIIGADSASPMVTQYPGTSAYHSFTYLSSQESGSSAGWYYFSSTDSVPIWLVRAYVSLSGTGVGNTVLNPVAFELRQNYPNPFNPKTEISYTLDRAGRVVLSVYNTLGELVDRLVNSDQESGPHSIAWAPASMPSGVYFYRLEVTPRLQDGTYTTAGAWSAVRKMVYIR